MKMSKREKREKRSKTPKPPGRVRENWKVITLEGKAYLYETLHNTEIAVATTGREDILKYIAQAANEGSARQSREGDLRRRLTKEITSRYVHLRDAFGKVRRQAEEIGEAFAFAERCLGSRDQDHR